MAEIASIGLFKSGTRSLIGAFRRLGYTTSEDTFNHARLGLWCSGYPALDYQQVQDEPCFAFWKLLAVSHPELRFVMTIRPFEDWMRSLRKTLGKPRDVTAQIRLLEQAEITAKQRTEKGEGRIYLERVLARHEQPISAALDFLLGVYGGGLDTSTTALARVYEEHHCGVRAYFAYQPWRLLEWDLTRDPKWEILCGWLGVPVPDEPFPWINKTRVP